MKLMYKTEGFLSMDWNEFGYPTDNDYLSIMLRAFLKADDWQELTIASANLGIVRTYQKWTDDGKAIAFAGTEPPAERRGP